jgi:hypothetical protein
MNIAAAMAVGNWLICVPSKSGETYRIDAAASAGQFSSEQMVPER